MRAADLELGFYRRDKSHYAVELRYCPPDSAVDRRSSSEKPVFIDWSRLRELESDSEAYGVLLGQIVFADRRLQLAFAEACSTAQDKNLTLRLQLFFGGSVHHMLHELRWETLRHPDQPGPLATNERLLFSRYLASQDWRTVRLTPRAELRALVVVSNPSDIQSYSPNQRPLAPIDVTGEVARARAALSGLALEVLDSGGRATLDGILDGVRRGFDLLYLVCHGALIDGEPCLWLEGESGRSATVGGDELITRLRAMPQLPRLIVLASCQSAGLGEARQSDDKGALAALGPQLAAAGVPAVVAMQGDISMSTVAEFMPKFFSELQKDGEIDRAMAVARGAVLKRPDWWVPVLFTRLRSGRLWYTPGFADPDTLEKWPSIVKNIRLRSCTPILGPGLIDSLLGSRRQIAERWAQDFHFPLAPHLREDLPQVAQFLAINQQLEFPRQELETHLQSELRKRYPEALQDAVPTESLDQLLSRVGVARRARDLEDPHRVLAQLPLPVYITTNFSSLLTDALKEANKDPVSDYFRWRPDLKELPSAYAEAEKSGYRPSPERPLVYHVFGHLSQPDSVVLTEDDYFKYLIGATQRRLEMPAPVLRALSDTALLFLGYQLDDWNFRVLFWTLLSAPQGGRRKGYAHVAAQLDPEEGRIVDPVRARRYLEDYFKQEDMFIRLSIYWGTAEQFVRELHQLWDREQRQAA
jgi:hypothetical protein